MAKERLFNNSKFVFVGNLGHGQEPMSTKRMGEGEWFKTKLNISVRDGANSPFLTMENIHKEANPDTVKVMGEKDSKGKYTWFDVPFNDMLSENDMKKVPDFLKLTIDLETDFEKKSEYTKLIFKRMNHESENRKLNNKKEDLTQEELAKVNENLKKIDEYTKQINELATNRKEVIMKDAIILLNKALPILKDKKIKVTGTPKCNFYNGKNQLQYVPSSIEIVPDDTKSQFRLFTDVFYAKDDVTNETKEKKMYISGYIGEVKNKEDKLFPLTLTVDYTKVDETIPQQKALMDYLLGVFTPKNKKMYYKNNIELSVIEGAEQIEFSIDCLTEEQKNQVKLGLASLEQFKPKGNVYGDRISELKVVRPTLQGDFKNGAIEMFKVDELVDFLVPDDSDVKEKDVKNEEPKEEVKEETNDSQSLMDTLFS